MLAGRLALPQPRPSAAYESPRHLTCEHSNSPTTPRTSSSDRTLSSGRFNPLIHTHQKSSFGSRRESTVRTGPGSFATV